MVTDQQAELAPPPTSPKRALHRDLGDVVREVWHYRELLGELTRRDLRIRYTQALMGILWAIITPLVVAASGWIIQLGISAVTGNPLVPAMLAAVAVKGLGWSFFAGAIGFGTNSITANLPLVTKVYFPRQVLPLSAVATQIVDSSIGALALIAGLPFLGVGLSTGLSWLPLLVILLVGLTVAVTLLASCANVFFRDARYIIHLVVSFGIFFTPVFFNADTFGPRASRLLMLNPLGPVLEGLRLAVVQGHDLAQPLASAGDAIGWEPWLLLWSAAWALGGCAIAALVFRRAEFAFAEYV